MCDQIQRCCAGLDSSKITERKKSAENLKELLGKSEIVKKLNIEDYTWDSVFISVHRYIKKEGEKLHNDENKNKELVAANISRVKILCHSLLLQIISKANSGEPKLEVTKLIECVFQCFESQYLRKYFGDLYLIVLVKCILFERKYWGKIEHNKWLDIYQCLKQLYVKPMEADQETILRGLYFTIEYGSLYSSLNFTLRQEFTFIKSLCKDLKSKNTKYTKQEIILQLLLSFNTQLAKECRMASCKLGEDIGKTLIDLYEARHENYGGKKSLIFDYFQLQMSLHHPYGVTQGCDAAYAFSWTKWKQLLRYLYSILSSEISFRTKLKISSNNDSIPELWQNFQTLFVEVIRQVLHCEIHEVTQASVLAQFTELSQTAKRPRLETGIHVLIVEIQKKDNWQWLSILSELLTTYPSTLQHDDFVTTLEDLANTQSECNDKVTRHYLYKLLNTMVQAQDHLAGEYLDLERLEHLWIKVWQSTLRSVGLNQNEDLSHRQLQLMLQLKKSPQPMELLNIFTSGVLNISTHSIKTLYTLYQTIAIPECSPTNPELMIRSYLINSILSTNDDKVLSSRMTANVLTGLVTKLWPYQKKLVHTVEQIGQHKSIEDTYILSTFEGGLIFHQTIKKSEEKSDNNVIHNEAFSELENCINSFVRRICNDEMNSIILINGIILILNLLSSLLEVGLITEANYEDFVMTSDIFDCLYNALNQQKNNMESLLKSIKNMLTQKYHRLVSNLLRQNISTEFLKIFFDLCNSDEVDGTDDMEDPSNSFSRDLILPSSSKSPSEELLNDREKVNLACVEILSHYCCSLNSSQLTRRQKHVLDALCKSEFNANSNIEFKITVYFLQTLNTCAIGAINHKMEFFLNAMRNMMEARFEDYRAVLLLLNILKDAIPHIFSSNSDESKQNILTLIEPFYQKRESFGPQVSVALINCLGNIIKMDPTFEFAKIKDVIGKLVGFLKSDFHEIRLVAIKNILNIFMIHKDSSKRTVKQQNEVLLEVHKKIIESFVMAVDIEEEQKVDETANRTASALHMYSALIAAHPIWRKKTLYFLVQLTFEKKIHIDLIKKVLSIVGQYLEIRDVNIFLNNNVNYIVTQWNRQGRRLSEFPFSLFGCENEVNFSIKYTNEVVPVLLQQEGSDILKNVCLELKKSITEVLKECYPSILAQFLPIYVSGKSSEAQNISNEDLLLAKRLFKQLTELLNCDKDPSIMIHKLDLLFIELLHRFFDCDHFENQFDFNIILPEPDPPFFDLKMFLDTVSYIERKLPANNTSLVSYCIKSSPYKLENIFLSLTINLYSSRTIEEILISFQRYTVLVNCIIPELRSHNNMNTFFIRNITYTLVNIIKLNKFELSSIAACRYFKTFIEKILPSCSIIFEKFLALVVNTLVPLIKLNGELSTECENILKFLIVDNTKYLFNSIGTLDPFPKDDKFANIQEVYERIKYGNDSFSLEEEIRHFLNIGDIYDRTEGLQNLRTQFLTKKSELNKLYSDLNKSRGFCDDCENSIIHQLICLLVKLSTSANPQVRLEAARCLGELGPYDLTTLVLKPEKTYINKYLSPLELVAGQILVLLSELLVKYDPEVIKATSNALYAVLNSKEGYFIAATSENQDHAFGILQQAYLFPYIPLQKPKESTNVSVDENLFSSSVNQSDLWLPTMQCSHSEWITSLVTALLNAFPEKCFLRDLVPVCQIEIQFCEKMLPLTIYLILCQNLDICSKWISMQMDKFFENHWQGTIYNRNLLSQNSADSVVIFNPASVQCMLNVVHFIRLRRSVCYDQNAIDDLKLNYLHVAQAALFCSAYFTSILYAELWCYDKLDENPITDTQSTASTLENVCLNQRNDLKLALENMLREAYKRIGDLDAIHGCGTSYIANTESRIDYYKNLGRWDKVILHYDTQLGFGTQNASFDLANALKNHGLYYLSSTIKSDELSKQYECAWRLGQWNFQTNSVAKSNEFERYHYLALRCVHEGDFGGMKEAISVARTYVIDNLAHTSLESSKSLYRPLSELHMLQEIEDFAEAKELLKIEDLLEKWKMFDIKNEFDYIEPIRAQRIALLNDVYLNDDTDLVKPYLVDLHIQLTEEARMEGFYNVANRSLNSLSFIQNLTSEMKDNVLFEQAQILWIDDKISARHLLKDLLDNNSMNPQKLGEATRVYGNWMVETRSENPDRIRDKYFLPSLKLLEDFMHTQKDVENLCETLVSYARFGDSQYQEVSNYISSACFASKIKTIQKFRNMALSLRQATGDKTSDEKRAIALYERQSVIDEKEVENTCNQKNLYLYIAVNKYLQILDLCDSYNFTVFRILSLSLENKSNEDLLAILEEKLPKISSYKFIPLLPQLVPHIGSNQNESFESIIKDILEHCAFDHPYHTLPIIQALADSYKDRNFDSKCTSESLESRVQIAKDLITKLKKKKNLTQVINNMEKVSTALISLAYVDASKCSKGKSTFIIPRAETIRMIKEFDNVLVPTINLEVRKDKNYNNIIGIREFSTTFSLVGGVNAPKKITCLGTDGIHRTQLVKGKDDLRQDAVMQQVFNILNTLLAKNKHTRKLLIRTYKVVPLSQRSGVLEWCENTEPLGSYLNEAHKKYHPNDISPNEARGQLKAVHTKDHDIKYRKYQEICLKLRPVFHMFFISSYPQPTIWFERRRAYMHSVATSSMVGYILGLGDRHVHNILLDKNTAEVVHIDFGIAFEQGSVLPTPETVPFRLTRDIEAGMGICGVEGVFRRSCEKTMQVLRQNAETVLTILEVLLYDPLYVWTITPAEAYSRQRDDKEEQYEFSDDDPTPVNVTAERALFRLKQKLQGTENGGVCSVEGQVELLLQQARDPINLSRLFNGWQAYL